MTCCTSGRYLANFSQVIRKIGLVLAPSISSTGIVSLSAFAGVNGGGGGRGRNAAPDHVRILVDEGEVLAPIRSRVSWPNT